MILVLMIVFVSRVSLVIFVARRLFISKNGDVIVRVVGSSGGIKGFLGVMGYLLSVIRDLLFIYMGCTIYQFFNLYSSILMC